MVCFGYVLQVVFIRPSFASTLLARHSSIRNYNANTTRAHAGNRFRSSVAENQILACIYSFLGFPHTRSVLILEIVFENAMLSCAPCDEG